MTVESVTVPQTLDPTYPAAGDDKSEGDNHIRNLKRMAVLIGWEYVGKATASASSYISTYDIAPFVTGYDYQVVFSEVYFSADAASFNLYATTGGGVQDTANDFPHAARGADSVPSINTVSSLAQNYVTLIDADTGNATTERCGGEVTIINPYSASGLRPVQFKVINNNGGVASSLYGGAAYKPLTAVDGLYFASSSGTITAGTFSLYRRYRV